MTQVRHAMVSSFFFILLKPGSGRPCSRSPLHCLPASIIPWAFSGRSHPNRKIDISDKHMQPRLVDKETQVV